MRKTYEILKEHFKSVEFVGTNLEAAMIWDSILCFQSKHKVIGNLLEIGVGQGSGVRILALHANENENIDMVDLGIGDRKEKTFKAIQKVRNLEDIKMSYYKKKSMYFERDITKQMLKSYRWIHIDAGHTMQDVINDIKIADMLLDENGMICLDDFFNVRYPQITKAVFYYQFSTCNQLIPLLVGFNKAFICRPSAIKLYSNFIKNELINELELRNIETTLLKTSYSSEMICYGIRNRKGNCRYIGPDFDVKNIDDLV